MRRQQTFYCFRRQRVHLQTRQYCELNIQWKCIVGPLRIVRLVTRTLREISKPYADSKTRIRSGSENYRCHKRCHGRTIELWPIYTVSQKKTSPTFLAITRESIDGFL